MESEQITMICKMLESQIFVNVRGQYQFCCNSTDRNNTQTIWNCSPAEWLNSSHVSRAKESLSNGVWPHACLTCKNQEESGLSSRRLDYKEMGPDIEMLDLRFSNKCNLKCISCTPSCSSSIFEEALAMQSAGIIPIMAPNKPSMNWISEEILDQFVSLPVKKMNFAGGEPMMLRFLPEFLDKVDPSVEIKLTSNCTIYNPKLLKSLKRFKHAKISASIDAVGKRIEYIRYGSVWETIEENIKKYSDVAEINITSCISVLNAIYYDELKDWADNNQLPIFNDILEEPNWLNIRHAPEKLKIKMLYFPWVSNVTSNLDYISAFVGNIWKLDSYRKVHIRDYLPEVANAYNM